MFEKIMLVLNILIILAALWVVIEAVDLLWVLRQHRRKNERN